MSPESSEEIGFWKRSLADRYRVERELGRGGMATVFLAEDLRHRRRVAVKAPRPEVALAIGQQRFLREIEVVAGLTHPHILPLFDSGAVEGRLFYVMPYVEGESLRERLQRETRLPLDQAMRIAHQVASALGHAHQRGLVHRDVKPENVLLADGIALVADFGIARVSEPDPAAPLTTAGLALGTPAYMAPEQVLGRADVDGRADVYGLACMLFEMLAGHPPFTGAPESLGHQHVSIPAPALGAIRPEIPPAVADVIATALAKSPDRRFPTAARFAEALATAGSAPSTSASPGRAVSVPNNLPAERTRFVGRERELANCARRLEETRLLTITGIGGGGKTRFVVRLAATVSDRFPDGVWFADLAPLGEPARVVEAVASVLGVKEESHADPVASLATRLAAKRTLLVLDNCEHLTDACATLANDLLAAVPELRILATSREGFGVEGERQMSLPSLGVPALNASAAEAVGDSESVQLFLDRAKLVLHDFELDGTNAAPIAEICRRLDGIPLAIELAAARMKVLSVDQIRARLDDRFRLLTGGSRTALPRHQTLRATLQWSYEQLPSAEQRMLRTLSVFAGGWTLESAAAVAGGDADEFETMDLLTRLVNKSLVVVERRASGETRYRLLETVRQYGQEMLAGASEAAEARDRHAIEFTNLAERAYARRFVEQELWAARLEGEHDNLRSALEFTRDVDAERHLRLAGVLAWFWQLRSHLLEGRAHLEAAMGRTPSEPPRAARARALWGMANTSIWQGDGATALPLMHEALAIWKRLEEHDEVALALEGIGWAEFIGGEDERACAIFEECLRLARARGDAVQVNRAMVGHAQVLVALHRVDEARSSAREILAFSVPRADRRSEHFAWHYIADCALIEARCAESLGHYRKSLTLAQPLGDRLEMSFEVQGVAMSLAGLGQSHPALRLAGACHAEWRRLGVDMHMRFWDELLDRYLGSARRALGDEAAHRAWEEGTAIPFDDAMRMALESEVRA
jgi:predicted ATPase